MQKEYFNMKEEASPSPSEGGDVFPQTLLSFEKKPLPQPQLQPPQAPPKEGMCSLKRFFLSKRSLSPNPIYSLTPNPSPNGEGSENYCLQMKRAFL